MTIENTATAGEWDTPEPVVVGVDGSERNRSAVAWAAHEAAAFGCGLTLVTAVPQHLLPAPGFTVHAQEKKALAMLSDVRDDLGVVNQSSVSISAVAGEPGAVLLEKAEHSGLPVVVGVDLDKPDEEPIETAFGRARRLGVPLVAVHGWETPMAYSWDTAAVAGAVEEERRERETRFDALIASWVERHPDVAVRLMHAHKHPAAAILEAAEDAQVVVLGRHSTGAMGGFAFGSVARAVLHYAECPVLVVPAGREPTATA